MVYQNGHQAQASIDSGDDEDPLIESEDSGALASFWLFTDFP